VLRWRDIKKGSIQKKNHPKIKVNFCDASLMARFKAFITDSFMLLMPLMYIVFYFIMGSRESYAEDKLLGWLYIFIPHFIMVISFWYFKAQTPGMKAYEIALINSQDSEKPTIFPLVIRYIIMTFSLLSIILLFVPYLNKKRKTLWDIFSGTCIKASPNE
jgi:uncharacterized RDD family membrane protein YckC